MRLTVDRTFFNDSTTSGVLNVDGVYFCETLEDCARGAGIKVPGKTCLPVGEYRVAVTMSNRFKRPMLLLYTNPHDLSCEHGGIRFVGVRIHGGNTHEDTEGCLLVAFDRQSPERISRSAAGALQERVEAALAAGQDVTLEIRNAIPRAA